MTGILRVPRRAALAAITVLVTAASLVSFGESYRGLWLWATHHGLHGIWAAGFPAQVDVFIAVGELALFVALADAWPPRSRVAAWGVTVLGLAVSVTGNVGHITGHSLTSRATAAVPPLAAAAALAVGLGVLKRVVGAHHAVPAPAAVPVPGSAPESVPGAPAELNGTGHAALELFADDIAAGRVPGIRAIRSGLHLGAVRGAQVQAYLREITTNQEGGS